MENEYSIEMRKRYRKIRVHNEFQVGGWVDAHVPALSQLIIIHSLKSK